MAGRRRLPGPRGWLAAAVVLVLAGGGGAWLLTRQPTASAQTTTATVSSGTYKTTVSASGTVAAAKQADLAFGVSGTVTKVGVSPGDRVAKGQVLATVGRSSLRASLTAARSSLTAARTQLAEDTEADASDTQLAADRAAVLSAQSTVGSAVDNLADGSLRSTISGTVAAVDLSVGDVVTGGSGSTQTGGSAGGATGGGATTTADTTTTSTSTSTITVVSTKAYVVDATVASSDIATIKKGLQAQIAVTGVDDTIYGTVSSIGLVAQTSSSGAAEFPIEIAVTGAPKGLFAGSTANASIVVKQVANVLTVPTQALHTSGSTTYVTKVVAGKQVRTTVVTGTAYGMATQVRSGLKSGDTVVIATFTQRPGGSTAGQSGEGGQRGGFEGGFSGGQAPGGQGGPGGGFGGGQ